jgi:hypothetical protein
MSGDSGGFMSHEMTSSDPAEQKSLDVVQRVVASVLVGVVIGLFAVVLALYLVLRGPEDLGPGDVLGLWVMTGVLGLVASSAILLLNRRKLYHPAQLLGLLPMAASWYWIFH